MVEQKSEGELCLGRPAYRIMALFINLCLYLQLLCVNLQPSSSCWYLVMVFWGRTKQGCEKTHSFCWKRDSDPWRVHVLSLEAIFSPFSCYENKEKKKKSLKLQFFKIFSWQLNGNNIFKGYFNYIYLDFP